MLIIEPEKRFTGHKALKHAWFKMYDSNKGAAEHKISHDVIKRLQSFRGVSTFKKAAMNLLVKTATEDEVKDLRAQFQAIDKDGTGMIQAQELHDVLIQKRMGISDTEIRDMISEIDYHNNKKINYSEFLAATINVKHFLTDNRLLAVFNQFDTDNSGKITKENIVLAMQKLSGGISPEEVDETMKQHDIKGDGVINFEEFKAIFFKDEPEAGPDMPFGEEGPAAV